MKEFRLTVLVSGGGTNLQALIDKIEEGRIPFARITAVISNNSGVFALTRAERAGIPASVIRPKDFADREAFNKALKYAVDRTKPDLIVLAGCLLRIPEEIISAYPNRIVNIHPALIPSFCGKGFYGLKVHEEALKRGVRVSGATVHFVSSGLDEGPIILQKPVEVKEGDTPEILQRRIMEEAEWEILPEAVRLIAEGRVSVDEDGRVRIKEETEDSR